MHISDEERSSPTPGMFRQNFDKLSGSALSLGMVWLSARNGRHPQGSRFCQTMQSVISEYRFQALDTSPWHFLDLATWLGGMTWRYANRVTSVKSVAETWKESPNPISTCAMSWARCLLKNCTFCVSGISAAIQLWLSSSSIRSSRR